MVERKMNEEQFISHWCANPSATAKQIGVHFGVSAATVTGMHKRLGKMSVDGVPMWDACRKAGLAIPVKLATGSRGKQARAAHDILAAVVKLVPAKRSK